MIQTEGVLQRPQSWGSEAKALASALPGEVAAPAFLLCVSLGLLLTFSKLPFPCLSNENGPLLTGLVRVTQDNGCDGISTVRGAQS